MWNTNEPLCTKSKTSTDSNNHYNVISGYVPQRSRSNSNSKHSDWDHAPIFYLIVQKKRDVRTRTVVHEVKTHTSGGPRTADDPIRAMCRRRPTTTNKKMSTEEKNGSQTSKPHAHNNRTATSLAFCNPESGLSTHLDRDVLPKTWINPRPCAMFLLEITHICRNELFIYFPESERDRKRADDNTKPTDNFTGRHRQHQV